MTVKIGDAIPEGTLTEFVEVEGGGCSVGPNDFKVSDLVKGKKILMFALPGAFTPTCSAQHVPGFVTHHDAISAKGVDEVWCVAVNDAFVMGAWGREQHSDGKVRMLSDGSCHWTKAMGLELDLTARNMGVRSQRYAAIIDNGVIKALEVEAPGKFEVSSAEAMIKHL
jgi:peroxiredoxin